MKPVGLLVLKNSGRSTIINHAIYNSGVNASIAKLSCSYGTTSIDLIKLLSRFCMSASSGKVLRPKRGERLIVVVENLDLCKKDSWNSCEIVNILQQLIAHEGYYDNNQNWVNLEKVQFVFTLNQNFEEKISSRFLSLLRYVNGMASDNNEKLAVLNSLGQAKETSKSTNFNITFDISKYSYTKILRLLDVNHERYESHRSEKLVYESSILTQHFQNLESRANPLSGYVFNPEYCKIEEARDNLKIVQRQFSRDIRNINGVDLSDRIIRLYGYCYNGLCNNYAGGMLLTGESGSGRRDSLMLVGLGFLENLKSPPKAPEPKAQKYGLGYFFPFVDLTNKVKKSGQILPIFFNFAKFWQNLTCKKS